MATIHGKEHALGNIFSDSFSFSIPSFQRPYAWEEEHAMALINDLTAFMKEAESPQKLPPYFLGSIVLIKEEKQPDAEVVDGQQRLTTLTILLAVLRELVSPEYKNFINGFLYQEGNPITCTPSRYRLTLRERDADFFRQYIQDPGGINKIKDLDPATLSDSQKKIRSNALLLLQSVEELLENDRFRLAQAIMLNCYLVEISTSDLESAYNVFSILNDRGLNLSHTDILKAQIIGKTLPSQRKKYTTKWEDTEESLGREGFSKLFTYLNIIHGEEHRSEAFLTNFRKNVYPANNSNPSPAQFIDEVFIPHANALNIFEQATYRSTTHTQQVINMLKWHKILSSYFFGHTVSLLIEDYYTCTIIHFLSKYLNKPEEVLKFLEHLERLSVVLIGIYSSSILKRYRSPMRYKEIIALIKNEQDLYAENSPLHITNSEKTEFIEILSGDMYNNDLCRYILSRLDYELAAAKEARYDWENITVEHVLPQNPKPNSVWMEWFPEKISRKEYTNNLGNLVLLSRPLNSAAQNYDFKVKKTKYFRSPRGTSSFALTTQVLQEEEWTPEVIERRQQLLISTLKKLWHLDDN